jgi:hypothetical protein
MGQLSRRALLENPGALLAKAKQTSARIGGFSEETELPHNSSCYIN